MAATLRSFIAIDIPPQIRRELGNLQIALGKSKTDYVKWVDPSIIHLTLKFLGNISAEQIEPIYTALQTALQDYEPFRLSVSSTGAFPGLNRVQTVWAGLSGDLQTLAGLQQTLDNALLKLGFPKETRGFSPHLTLGRVRDNAGLIQRQNLGRTISQVVMPHLPGFAVEAVNLMESKLTPQGPVYRVFEISQSH